MSKIQFLNIDLDIESKEDLSLLIDEICDRVSIMRNENDNDIYKASFETAYAEENEIIQEYKSLIDSLSPKSKEIWSNCTKKVFDFGYESGFQPNNFHSLINEKSIKILAELGGCVAVTIYPAEIKNT